MQVCTLSDPGIDITTVAITGTDSDLDYPDISESLRTF
jgi:hypothetical protein